ncbi:MAG: heme lyase CcmF/NrfE family subunit [Deltaproteobacteria bacterium]|nr:heme lyase CcmF/NrfE family subunit [Deltaproteobacteria bacterium]
MVNSIGYVFITAALAVSLFGVAAPALGAWRNNWNLVRSAQLSAAVNFVFVFLASVILLRAFLADDFSVRFVFENSSPDLPLFYKITAFWGGMDGSLLFWDLVLAGYTVFVAFRYQSTNRELLPWVLVTLNLIHVFLLGLLSTYSNPLATQFPIPDTGRGLNPLLQHPAMAIHPPALYLGYIGLSIPFAFAMASLVTGRLNNEWVVTTRRWTLTAWYFLTMGQMLGGEWAYEELGWGGYWAWDPVENAAFLPWLTATAFLHSIMIQEKRNMMKVWNMSLIILTFGLSILGTFIVRSGVLNSVHAFAQSEVGPAFLVFLAIMLTGAFALMFKRIKMLESRHTADKLLSKEATFLLNNLLFIGIAFTVFLGTVFPILAEGIRGTKLSIQAPFFNTLVTPMGSLLLLLIGVCTLIAWRQSSWDFLLKNFRLPVVMGVASGFLAALLAGVEHIWGLIIFGSAGFTLTVMVMDFTRAVRVRQSQGGGAVLMAALSTIGRNKQRYGGMVVHLGMVFMFIGLAGNFFATEYNMTLKPGETSTVGEYKLLYKGMTDDKKGNADLRVAQVDLYRNGEMVREMRPAASYYPTRPQPLTEVDIYRNLEHDFYMALASENPDGSVTLRVLVNPLVVWAWMGLPLFTLGYLIAVFYRPKTLRTTPVV